MIKINQAVHGSLGQIWITQTSWFELHRATTDVDSDDACSLWRLGIRIFGGEPKVPDTTLPMEGMEGGSPYYKCFSDSWPILQQ